MGEVAHIDNEACTSVTVGVDRRTSFVHPTSKYQNLREYFERPRLVASGFITTVRQAMYTQDLTPGVLFTTWFPNALVRLAGVYGVRFTIRFTVTTAATPFQQGLMAQSFQYGQDSTAVGGSVNYRRFAESAMVTNLPHVRHSLTDNTMTQFDVPFLYARDFLPLYGGAATDSLGIYSWNALMPYRAVAGSAAPTYKIMVSLHDLELIGSYPQTATSVIVQSGLIQPQAGPVQAEKAKLLGSTVLTSAADKVRTIGAFVPSLSSLSGPTASVLEAAASVARAFGYSRPQVEKEPRRVYPTDYLADLNTDIPSSSYVLSPFQKNAMRVDDLSGGTDTDEMSIAYVLSQPCQAFIGDFTTTDAVGTTLYATAVCPTNFWFRTNSSRPGGNLPLPSSSPLTANAILPTTLCYVSSMFRYWRGTLRFRFTFSKTKFHAGRVIAAFVPLLQDVAANGTLGTTVFSIENGGLPQPFSYCEVFDLRDSDTFEFEVPYISPTPYTNVLSSIGGLTLTVLDPLVVTGETAGTVDYMVEVSAGDDFQFGCAAPPMLTPASQTGTGVVFLQSGLGGVTKPPLDVDEYTTGEVFKSLKTLMMIPSYINADMVTASFNFTTLPPFWVRARWSMATPMPNSSSLQWAFTRSGNIAACYAFATGSTEYHAYHTGPTSGVIMSVASNEKDGNISGSSNGDPRNRSATGKHRVLTTEGSLHVRVPSYQRVARVPTSELGSAFTDIRIGSQTSVGSNYIQNFNQLGLVNTSGSLIRIYLGRAAADDARCTGWIGPPPVVLFQSTNTALPDNPGIANF